MFEKVSLKLHFTLDPPPYLERCNKNKWGSISLYFKKNLRKIRFIFCLDVSTTYIYHLGQEDQKLNFIVKQRAKQQGKTEKAILTELGISSPLTPAQRWLTKNPLKKISSKKSSSGTSTGNAGSGLFNTSLKCSCYLCCTSCSVDSRHPFLSLTLSILLVCWLHIFFVVL